MTACARAGLWGGMTKAAGRKTPTCAETVRRLEHPHRQEFDDQNAAGMKPRCPAPPDWSILHLQDNRTSFFLIYAPSITTESVCCEVDGFPSTRADGHKPNTHCRRAGFHHPMRSALGTAGRWYGGASYPAPLSLAAIVAPTAGRAAKPPVPLSCGTLFPA